MLLPKEKPKKPNDPKALASDPDGWWALAKGKILNDPKKFLQDLIDYKKDEIPDSLILKVKPLMEKEEMSEAVVKKAASYLVPVRIWIAAMITYHEVLKIVNPKREIAATMGAKLSIVQSNLNEKRAKVKEINDKLDSLQN
jgi:dynein heavy chain